MRFLHFDPAPVVRSIGTVLGERGAVDVDLAALTGDSPLRYRRMDRYAALGFAAAQIALRRAGVVPAAAADPEWGIVLGSSTGCWSSNAGFFRDLLRLPAAELSPAVFARTVANTVSGEISIAHGIGGTSETFVSGPAAGAEALVEAGCRIAEGKARFVLAGGVEAPDAAIATLERAARAEQDPASLRQAAGIALLGRTGSGPKLRSFARFRDPDGTWMLSEALSGAGLHACSVFACGAIAPALAQRWRSELPHQRIEYVDAGLGAAGVAFALERAGDAPALLVCRGWDGATVLLAVGPGLDRTAP